MVPLRSMTFAVSRRSALEARAFRVKFPVGNEILHCHRIVAGTQAVLLVELMRLCYLGHIELDTEPRLLRHLDEAPFDLQRLFREALPVLPDPVRVDRGHASGGSGADVS